MKGQDKMKKLKLKWWVKVVLYILFLILLSYIIISLFKTKTVTITEGKNYTCYGSRIFQVCSGVDYDAR